MADFTTVKPLFASKTFWGGLVAVLAGAIERHEPRVRVQSIEFPTDTTANADGTFFPTVILSLKEDVL